jgi:phosphoribosylaminoimidazole-succinocarboxamide synthase
MYNFPDGLRKNQRLPEPTHPTTKGGATGHDERLTSAEVVSTGLVDAQTWGLVQAAALAVFKFGREVAERMGLILVDTKYEFGLGEDGALLLIDEVHTPDSSRFWRAETYAARFESGRNLKTSTRNLSARLRRKTAMGSRPSCRLLWASASERYIKIVENLTGENLSREYPVELDWLKPEKQEDLIYDPAAGSHPDGSVPTGSLQENRRGMQELRA